MDNRTIEQVRQNETELIKELEQKENILKEVRERLIKPSKFIERTERLKLLDILDKENKE